MPFRPFSGRTLTTFLAGLAATSISSPGLKGLGTPFLAGWAGLRTRRILHRPGIWNTPFPFLPRALPISAVIASNTAATSFLARPVVVAMLANTSDLPAGLGLGAFLAIVSHPPCEVCERLETTVVRPSASRIGGKLDSFQAKMQPSEGQKAWKIGKFRGFRPVRARNCPVFRASELCDPPVTLPRAPFVAPGTGVL